MKYLYALILILLMQMTLSAQIETGKPLLRTYEPDPADSMYYSSKRGGHATALAFGINIGVWVFDRFIQKGDFAYINLRTIRENFRYGFIWDNDRMGTNMFLHPYHGNLYYNAARSNGFNYWLSGIFAIGGSTMWELFMECEYPSTNDIIATPLGGMALGEVLYRASDLILDDRARGTNRLGREAAAFLVSPMRGLTRIINGDAWRTRATSGRQFGAPPVKLELSAGVRVLELKDDIFDQGVGVATEIRVEYGEKYEVENRKPYDHFTLGGNLNIQASQPLLGELMIIGRLIAKELKETDKKVLTLGLYQHFDYFDSDTISDISAKTPYKFCTPASFGVGLLYKTERLKRGTFEAYTHLNGILLGAALSDYYRVNERNYNLANGLSGKLGFEYNTYNGKYRIYSDLNFYHMFTWKGYPADINWDDFNPKTLNAQGDRSRAWLYNTNFRVDMRLKNHLYLTAHFSNYFRRTDYRYYDEATSSTTETRLMLTWRFR